MWPYTGLVTPPGWTPVPFREVVLKVHQRCDLACDYCYVYEHADQSWRDKPAVLPDEVRDAAVEAIARHAAQHGLRRVRVVLHGGEPLLYGADRLGELATRLRARAPVEVVIQTNGVGLTRPVIATLRRHRIGIGVSVDGVAADHDRHRRFRSGRGSYALVERALTALDGDLAGLLCTVAPDTDPVRCYRTLAAFRPPAIDFLLPHATAADPPPPGVGDWLIRAFDHWYDARDGIRVRLFDDAIATLLGGDARGEQLGLSPSALVVIETDGAIEQVDALKSAYPGAAATGLNVLRDDLGDALRHPGVVARQIGLSALAQDCQDCPVVRACGGGHYAHRYRPGAGFRHRSVYCAELFAFLRHAGQRLASDLAVRHGS